MNTYRQFLYEEFEVWGKAQTSTEYQPNVDQAENAFKALVNSPEFCSDKDGRQYVWLHFFRPRGAYHLKSDRKSEFYKSLKKKYGKRFAFVYIELIEVDKDQRGKKIGKTILSKLVELSKRFKIPLFLQASAKKGTDLNFLVNKFYKDAGFKVSDFSIPDELNVFTKLDKNATKGPHSVVQDFDEVTMEFLP